MDEGALLPWWGLATIEFSDSVVQDEPVADEAMIAAFLVAGASGAESAESFVAGNPLNTIRIQVVHKTAVQQYKRCSVYILSPV